jgi:hypothetical protein
MQKCQYKEISLLLFLNFNQKRFPKWLGFQGSQPPPVFSIKCPNQRETTSFTVFHFFYLFFKCSATTNILFVEYWLHASSKIGNLLLKALYTKYHPSPITALLVNFKDAK